MSQLFEDMILTNVLSDIYKSNVNELPKKHCILYIALEEMFHDMKKGNPSIKIAMDKSKNEYLELYILQEIFSTRSDANDIIKSYFKWIYKNIKDDNFVINLWETIVKKGSVNDAIRTTFDNNTGKLEHEIRTN